MTHVSLGGRHDAARPYVLAEWRVLLLDPKTDARRAAMPRRRPKEGLWDNAELVGDEGLEPPAFCV